MSARLLAFLCFGASIVAAMAGDARADSELPPVTGPKKVCLKYSSFDLLDGEQVTDSQGGVEGVLLQVSGPAGRFSVGESEITGAPKPSGTLVATSGGTKVYRMKDDGRVFYALYGHVDIRGEGDKPIIFLHGSAFTGGKADARIYGRFQIGDPKGVKCGHYYDYGWEYVLPDTGDTK
ncbi:MAG: hypothetical protein ABI471_12290 [Sphingomonas bacterium]